MRLRPATMPVDDAAAAESDVDRYLLAVVSYTDAKRNLDTDNEFDDELRDKAPKFTVEDE